MVQNGSLPAYVAAVLVTFVGLTAFAATRGLIVHGLPLVRWTPGRGRDGRSCCSSPPGSSLAPQRFGAVILLGAVGYSLSLVYLLYGALTWPSHSSSWNR
ncbi:MAG: hypothetical protein R2715_05765 [Ilumatobacteraceae bacterium]